MSIERSIGLRYQFGTLPFKAVLLASVALVALPLTGRAQAPTTPPAPNAQSGALEQIVVTAERRAVNIQKSPIAIQALSSAQLARQGITSGAQLAEAVTGLKVLTQGPVTSLYIRGIGNANSNPYGDPDVTYNVDGVALSLPSGPSGSIFDVSRVEVLKGPQGTLYGRNATSGAVNVITNDPNFKYGGSLDFQGGNYGLFQSDGMINVPVTDTFAVRGAFQTVRHDGYLTDGKDDQDDAAARIKALWRPNDDLTIRLGADYYHQGGKGPGSVPLATDGQYLAGDGSNPWQTQADYTNNGGAPPFAAYAHQINGGVIQVDDPNTYLNNMEAAVWAQADWNLGFGTLTLLPAYRNMKQDWYATDFGFGFQQNINDQTTTMEARLASNESTPSWLKWVAGVYALNEDLPNIIHVQQSFVPTDSNFPKGLQTTATPEDHSNSYAAFAQTTVSLQNWLRLTGGIRWTDDHKKEAGYTIDFLPTIANPTATGSYFTNYSVASNHITWKTGIDADVGPHSIVYGNIATGYKVGGFGSAPNPSQLIPEPTLATYKPETITAYDVGTKNDFLDHSLRFNLEAFYWVYDNQQINTVAVDPVAPGINGLVAGQQNARHGDDEGFDADVTYMLTDNDRITLSTEYLYTNYTSFTYSFLFIANLVNNAGRPFNNAPRWSGDLSYSHDFEFGTGASLMASVDTRLSSSYWVDYDYTPGAERQAGYSKTNFDLTYTSPSGKWYVGAWVRNIENTAVKQYAGTSIPGGPNGPDGQGIQWTDLEPPRTFGFRVGTKF